MVIKQNFVEPLASAAGAIFIDLYKDPSRCNDVDGCVYQRRWTVTKRNRACQLQLTDPVVQSKVNPVLRTFNRLDVHYRIIRIGLCDLNEMK